MCAVLLDPESGLVRYATAGHPPPLTVRADVGATYLPVDRGCGARHRAPVPGRSSTSWSTASCCCSTPTAWSTRSGPSAQGTVELAQAGLRAAACSRRRASDETPLVQRVCTGLLEQATRSGFADDVVLLALHRAPAGPALHLSLDDDPASLPRRTP